MAEKPCVFCQIVSGEAVAYEVWRDDDLVAFLDTKPVFHGHVLMVPTVHIRTYDQLPVRLAEHWLTTSQRLQLAVQDARRADGSLILMNNVVSQSVPHLHLHVIPRVRKDGLRFWLGPRHPYASDAQAKDTADRIKELLDRQ
ncbi:HIT family protein [Fodinicola acaciae]|uniref:HIT family protein n=1 Tax=Fodinicola acaciae TaxID=2681555 RepID=UPI001C9E9738|nr:HIT family protein [Fodinicola acaciae]